MKEHGPGPWEAEPLGGRGAWIKDANGQWCALACGKTDEDAQANAQLIAAAPDLLKALVDLSNAVFGFKSGDEPNVYSDYDRLTVLSRAAHAAIARATGAA